MVKSSRSICRGEIYLVDLDPARGKEIKKSRPCVVVSPDDLNENLQTFIVAPLTTGSHAYPFRVSCNFQRKKGFIVLDQIRTVDRRRLVRRLGKLRPDTLKATLDIFQEMFAA